MSARKRKWMRSPRHRGERAERKAPHTKLNGERARVIEMGSWSDLSQSRWNSHYKHDLGYLKSKVGQSWDKIWSQVCHRYRKKVDFWRRNQIWNMVFNDGDPNLAMEFMVEDGILVELPRHQYQYQSPTPPGAVITMEQFLKQFLHYAEIKQKNLNLILKEVGATVGDCKNRPCTKMVLTPIVRYYSEMVYKGRVVRKYSTYPSYRYAEREVTWKEKKLHDMDACEHRAIIHTLPLKEVALAVWEKLAVYRHWWAEGSYPQNDSLMKRLLQQLEWDY